MSETPENVQDLVIEYFEQANDVITKLHESMMEVASQFATPTVDLDPQGYWVKAAGLTEIDVAATVINNDLEPDGQSTTSLYFRPVDGGTGFDSSQVRVFVMLDPK